MLLVLPPKKKKKGANQDVLILLMGVCIITLFTLTFCHCGHVFLSLLGTLAGVGSAGVVLRSWLRCAEHLPVRMRASPHPAAPAASSRCATVCPCPVLLGTLIRTSVKYRKFYPKNIYFVCEMKNMLFSMWPVRSAQDWVIRWSRNSPL